MLILKRLSIWAIERAIELGLGAYLLLDFFGTNNSSAYPGFTGDLYINIIYVLFFYIASGFLVSTIYFGLWRRFPRPITQSMVLGACFLAHMCLFMFVGGIELGPVVLLALFGTSIVILSNFLGSLIFGKFRKGVNAQQ